MFINFIKKDFIDFNFGKVFMIAFFVFKSSEKSYS